MATRYTTLKTGQKDRFANSWLEYLSQGATITGSVWTLTGDPTGLIISSENTGELETSAHFEAVTGGTYRATNTVTFSDGAVGVEDILFSVPLAATPRNTYLTAADAQARLYAGFGIKADPLAGDLIAAAQELDSLSHRLAGLPYDENQPLAFPRSEVLPGDTEGLVPERILDWIALKAHQLHTEDQPPALEEKVDTLSVRYSRGKISRTERLLRSLLKPYLKGGRSIKIVSG